MRKQFTIAHRALIGQRWTPEEAKELRALLDAGEVPASTVKTADVCDHKWARLRCIGGGEKCVKCGAQRPTFKTPDLSAMPDWPWAEWVQEQGVGE